MKLPEKVKYFGGVARNVLSRDDIALIIESKGWAIWQFGHDLSTALNHYQGLRSRATESPYGVQARIMHFCSLHTMFFRQRIFYPDLYKWNILTVFHVLLNKPRYSLVSVLQKRFARVHVSCSLTKKQLVNIGVAPSKIAVIPLGIDLKLYSSVYQKKTKSQHGLRNQLGIPKDAFVIGSFQKDGIGWSGGDLPKLEKGPDIFAKTMAKLSGLHKIHVLLVGPSRGYLINKLSQYGVPYTSIGFLPRASDVANYYEALDLYLITSRVEGGPKGLLEAWACGVPVVSSAVGMITDIATDGSNLLVTEELKVDLIIKKIVKIMDDRDLTRRLTFEGREEVANYDWPILIKQYFRELYKPAIESIGAIKNDWKP